MAETAAQKIEKMSTIQLRRLVYDDPETARNLRDEIEARLMSLCWDIGAIWDKLEDTEPAGPWGTLGTRNRESMTYKLRKAANFSYP